MSSKIPLLIFLALIGCIANFGGDALSPALPQISSSLNTTMNKAQGTMPIYLFGVAFSLLFYGYLSEAYGRKKPLILGMLISLGGSIICIYASNIETLFLGRFIQGFGCGSGACLWRAIFRDKFQGDEMVKISSYFSILVTFIIPAAPAIGGLLIYLHSWRAIMVLMSILSVLAILSTQYIYQESHLSADKNKLSYDYFTTTIKSILKSTIFLRATLGVFFTFGAFFSWFTIGPVLLIKLLGMSPYHFGLISFFGGGLFFTLASFVNVKFISHLGSDTMLAIGWLTITCSGLLLCINYFLFGLSIYAILIPIFLLIFGSTLIWPNTFSIAMAPFADRAGYAGALYSLMQLGGGAVITSLVTVLPDKTPVALGLSICFCGACAWLSYFACKK